MLLVEVNVDRFDNLTNMKSDFNSYYYNVNALFYCKLLNLTSNFVCKDLYCLMNEYAEKICTESTDYWMN